MPSNFGSCITLIQCHVWLWSEVSLGVVVCSFVSIMIAYIARGNHCIVRFSKDFMNRMSQLTGKSTMETLKLLEAASPESRGILNKLDITLARLYNLIKGNESALELLRCEEHMASWALDCLLHLPGELGETFRKVSIEYGWKLAGGYDLTVPVSSMFLSLYGLGPWHQFLNYDIFLIAMERL
jgi:hypothetical protein